MGKYRSRKTLSCWPCRHRKLKCDRGVPVCSNCVYRGEITTCHYVQRTDRRDKFSASSLPLTDTAQRKLENLERLVIKLVKQQNGDDFGPFDINRPQNSRHNDTNYSKAKDLGNFVSERVLRGERDAIHLAGSDRGPRQSPNDGCWTLLLNEIHDVRTYLHDQYRPFEDHDKTLPSLPQRASVGPDLNLLFGTAGTVSRPQIMAHLPSRESCDKILTRFFSHLYPPLHILHIPTFQAQYEKFWMDPSETPIVWIAQLFAMLRIAMLDYLREDDEPEEWIGKCGDLSLDFRDRLADCMILADYLKPHEFLIESLILHQYAEYVSSRDAKSSIWVLTGTIARLAMRMGYHQAEQPMLTSTPFKTEMRRRAWAYIRQSDIMLSFQMGLPSMIDVVVHDCTLPRNIYDDARFHENCSALPPALPDSEPTQISYLIAKTKLIFGFARALSEVDQAPTVDWKRLLEIDRELRLIYENVPALYKLCKFSDQVSLVVTSARFSLANIHHRSLCIVHSKFLELATPNTKFTYSRRVCLNSAMSILRTQAIQDQDIPVDGRMRSLTNYQTSLALHDYLLAAAVVSRELCSFPQSDERSDQPTTPGMPTRAEMVKAIDISRQIFGKMRSQSDDARKAADILQLLIRKFEVENSTSHEPAQREISHRAIQGEQSTVLESVSSLQLGSSTYRACPTSLGSGANSSTAGSRYSLKTTWNVSSRSHWNTQCEFFDSSSLGLLPDGTSVDTHASWPEAQCSPFDQDLSLADSFPELIFSPDRYTEDQRSAGPNPSTGLTSSAISYESRLATHDPLSTLCSLL